MQSGQTEQVAQRAYAWTQARASARDALEIPHQQVVTREDAPLAIDGVISFMVQSAERVLVAVRDEILELVRELSAELRPAPLRENP